MRIAGVVVVVVSACSFEHGALSHDDDAAVSGDGKLPDATQLGAWGAAVEVIASGVGDDDPSLTDDMTELYFGSRRIPGQPYAGDENIWVLKRATVNDAWGLPIEVSALNTNGAETTMKVTGDGLTIFFSSDRNGSDADVYYSTRPDRMSDWSQPARITEINTTVGDYAAFAQKNLKHLVLCAGDITANEALYTSDRPVLAEPWGPPTRIAELDDSGVSECDPMERVSATGSVMYYSSWRLNTDKTYDIYRVDRPSSTSPWGNRTKVEGISSDNHHDRDPWVSADERTMYFSSTRDGSGVDKIYMSTR
jgi:hypothetical protein